MVMLSPAVQMPALAATRGCLAAMPQYLGAATAAALQPTIHNIAGCRLPQTTTYVTYFSWLLIAA